MMKKIVLITGGSGGLGMAAAEKFAAEGFQVVLTARQQPEACKFDFLAADLSREGAAAALAAEFASKYGRLDVLINNVGIGIYATWDELEEADLRKLFEVDFFVSVELTKRLLPMLRENAGTIVNISSVAGHIPVACMGPYSAVKAAMLMYSESLRIELKHENVRVTAICPGRIDTGFSKRALGSRPVPSTPGHRVSLEAYGKMLYNACRNKKRVVIFPLWYKLVIAFVRHFPGMYERISQKVWSLNKK